MSEKIRLGWKWLKVPNTLAYCSLEKVLWNRFLENGMNFREIREILFSVSPSTRQLRYWIFCPFHFICSLEQNFTKFYKILQNFTKFYKILQNFTKFHKILQNFTKFYKILQNFTKFYKILQNFTKFYKILQNFTKFYNWNQARRKLIQIEQIFSCNTAKFRSLLIEIRSITWIIISLS